MPKKIADRIGFLVPTVELFNHYRSIWILLDKARYVLVVLGESRNETAMLIRQAKSELLPVVSSEMLLRSGSKLRYLVSHHPIRTVGDHYLINDLALINVRMSYALGKLNWNFSSWNEFYDLILCFGPYQERMLAFCPNVIKKQVGYPRFDRYFQEDLVTESIRRDLGCDPTRETIVWLPTWQAQSSVDVFGAVLSKLGAQYNVVVKLHPLMVQTELERVNQLEQYQFTCLIKTPIDNVGLYKAADYVLCDYGGPPFGAIYVDKNLLLLNVPGASEDQRSGSGSPDVLIRQVIRSVSNPSVSNMRAALKDSRAWQFQREVRDRLRKFFFAPYYGTASVRVAEILLSLDQLFPPDHRGSNSCVSPESPRQ